jgi:DNA-binding NarL/FixJ family response regulator
MWRAVSLKVLIVDDHEVARVGLATLLQDCGCTVVSSVASGAAAIKSMKGTPVDLILLDVQMPTHDGITTLEKMRDLDPKIPIVLFSAYDNPTYIARAAAFGAHDYLLKVGLRESIGLCLTAITNGGVSPDSRLAKIRRIMDAEVDVNTLPPELPLTSREAQVLRHVALGLSNKEIARSLTISVETVKEHVQNLLRKTGTTDRTAAAVKAIKLGFVE